jgi:hypothetical protein
MEPIAFHKYFLKRYLIMIELLSIQLVLDHPKPDLA